MALGAALAAHVAAGQFRKIRASGTIRSFGLNEVALDGDTLALFKDGRLIADTCYFLDANQPAEELSLRSDRLVDLPGDRVHVMGCNLRQHHYGHWMTQCLPALHGSVGCYGAENVCLVVRALEPWQEETLALLGLARIPRLVPESGTQYRLPRAAYSEFLNGVASQQLALSLVGTAQSLSRTIAHRPSPYATIYVPAAAPFYGAIANEAELIACLLRHGVHVFAPVSLTLPERVSLFRSAAVVIGPHAEELVDCMFCKPGTLLWELMPRHCGNPGINRIAQAAGLHYRGDLFEAAEPGRASAWTVDIGLITAQLQAVGAAASRRFFPLRAVEGVAARTVMTQFESLGDNCEFGLAQRAAGAEPLGLLRFASFHCPVEQRLARLIAALEAGFEGLGRAGTLDLAAEGPDREFMIREAAYGLAYHTFRREGEVAPQRLEQSERARLAFLRQKLLDDLARGEKIWVWKSTATLESSQIMPLLTALRRYGRNTLLWVREAGDGSLPGTVEPISEGLLAGYVARFAPAENADDLDAGSWFDLCRAAYALLRGGAPETCAIPQPAADEPHGDPPFAGPRAALAGQLRAWLRSTLAPGTTPAALRAKGFHFLREADAAAQVELCDQFRALSYMHFEAADDILKPAGLGQTDPESA